MLLPLKYRVFSAKNNKVSDRRKSCGRPNILCWIFALRTSVADVICAGKKLKVYKDSDQLGREAARILFSHLKRAISRRGKAAIVLAGGSSPRGCYRELALMLKRNQEVLNRCFWFIGDERWVAEDNPESNENMIRKVLWEPAGVHGEKIFSWQAGSGEPAEKALAYEGMLKKFFRKLRAPKEPRGPDLVILGLGEDGHTASLFPHGQVIDGRGNKRPVAVDLHGLTAAIYVDHLEAYRLSMTAGFLASAANIYFIISGSNKKGVLKRVLSREPELPASWLNLKQTSFLVTAETV
ncbi:MAG TPA: 6-phosphogluconolactonase [Spirochaetales bacterium]|nr:6-phosphogluconolactonase [Spirochaetales bacterium]